MKPHLSTPPDWVVEPGLVPYPEAVAAMQARIAAIRAGTAPEKIWLLQHPPLYTAGTSAKAADLTNTQNFDTYAAGRGGQWTYHGPGQMVAYVMLDLTRPHGSLPPRDTHAYVAALEDWLIRTLARLGVLGERRPGRVGVWVIDAMSGAEAKIAAIGVRITRWVTWHGGIVPCGITEHGVTSLRALGLRTSISDAADTMRDCWRASFEHT
jgi:lipoyl(octanoyl) transferase